MQTHKIDGKMLDWLLFCEKVLYNNIQDGVIVLLGIEELGRADGGNEFSNKPYGQMILRIMSTHKIPRGFAPKKQGGSQGSLLGTRVC